MKELFIKTKIKLNKDFIKKKVLDYQIFIVVIVKARKEF